MSNTALVSEHYILLKQYKYPQIMIAYAMHVEVSIKIVLILKLTSLFLEKLYEQPYFFNKEVIEQSREMKRFLTIGDIWN